MKMAINTIPVTSNAFIHIIYIISFVVIVFTMYMFFVFILPTEKVDILLKVLKHIKQIFNFCDIYLFVLH